MARHVLKPPREMFNRRQLFAFWAFVGFMIGLAGEARAQVTLSPTGVTRRARPGFLTNTQINHDDCEVNEVIPFNVTLPTPNSAYSLQVWAGANCDVQTNRVTSTLLNCWQIGQGVAASSLTPPTLKVAVQDLLYGRTLASGGSTGISTGTSGSGGSGGTDSTAGSGGATTGATAGTTGASGSTSASTGDDPCTPKDLVTAAQTITLYFMLVDSSSNVQGAIATWNPTYKLLAPAPPDNVTAGIGENLLPIKFSYATPTSDTTINGYNFYCDPPPGIDAATDAGLLPGDGGIPTTSCANASPNLVQGGSVTGKDMYKCGSTGSSSATSGIATGLVDGVAYHVAVTTTDTYNNVGLLSKLDCQVPQPVTGFYEAYTDAGGRGGGGFCSFSRHPEPFLLLVLLGFGVGLVLRRRRAT